MCRYTYICICACINIYIWASLVVQTVKNLPEMQETQGQSLGWDDPLEKGMATHSSILVRRIPWSIVHGVAELDTTERLRLTYICIYKGTSFLSYAFLYYINNVSYVLSFKKINLF